MADVYICICGGQEFIIGEGFIKCSKCREEYNLRRFKALSGKEASVFESPAAFQDLIRGRTTKMENRADED